MESIGRDLTSPVQVRFIGSPSGGATTTSRINNLSVGAWAQFVSSQAQVAAIAAAEIPTLANTKIVALGLNIQYLSSTAIGALTATQKSVLSAAQHTACGC